ncbi:BLUF domain-containing protein [Brevundimonas sp.]|jgi:hypothetical protein|uniref:BLUF domain-containing protein n=1 Tax=Brevundimonas sp. TaxID=1871086 RepID=UPI0037BE9185
MRLDLESILYVSESVRPDPTLLTLAEILAASDRNNRRDGLTGALLVSSGHYLQVLEGAAQDLDRTLHRLEADPRHRALRILSRHPIRIRRFGDWAMVAARISPDQEAQMNEVIRAAPGDPDKAAQAMLDLVRSQRA